MITLDDPYVPCFLCIEYNQCKQFIRNVLINTKRNRIFMCLLIGYVALNYMCLYGLRRTYVVHVCDAVCLLVRKNEAKFISVGSMFNVQCFAWFIETVISITEIVHAVCYVFT